jgi:hypothetical protein
LVFDGLGYHDDLSRHRLLSCVEVTQRIKPLALKPVEQVLADLGHFG